MKISNLLFTLVCIFCLNSCSQAKQHTINHKTTQQKIEEDLFTSKRIRKPLNIKPHLTEQEKKEIQAISDKFNEIAKYFAYQEHYLGIQAEQKYCPKLIELYKDLSTRPISREREREMSRVYNLGMSVCEEGAGYYKSLPIGISFYSSIENSMKNTYTKGEWEKIYQEIPNSAQALRALAWREEKKHPEKAFKLFMQALKVDPIDLMPYKDLQDWRNIEFEFLSPEQVRSLKKEYCQAAARLKQWDHIFYVTNEQDEYIVPCMEAYKLVEPHWSYEYKMRHAE
jgi:hypothetical protein